jgi:hypothetical protein
VDVDLDVSVVVDDARPSVESRTTRVGALALGVSGRSDALPTVVHAYAHVQVHVHVAD